VIGLVVLFAFLIALTGFALWADATGWDPFADLYGSTDPRELVERAHRPRIQHHPKCAIELGFNACTCAAFEVAS